MRKTNLSQFRLGRNRIIDTHIAAAYAEACVTELWTANRADFEIFNMFDLPDYGNAGLGL